MYSGSDKKRSSAVHSALSKHVYFNDISLLRNDDDDDDDDDAVRYLLL